MTQAKEGLLTDTDSQNDCIVLDIEEFDLSDLDSLKNTALGNILEKDFYPSSSGHGKHSSHSSHGKYTKGTW
ncbi:MULTISPECIES: hypothetical protein [unclassified Microcoleus]|uniref:hypothetical protein n=1 Tax=unclassified Microcoleus TaxID=2642155 RepID=UPI002FD0A5FB